MEDLKVGDRVKRWPSEVTKGFTDACRNMAPPKQPTEVFIIDYVNGNCIRLKGMASTWSAECFYRLGAKCKAKTSTKTEDPKEIQLIFGPNNNVSPVCTETDKLSDKHEGIKFDGTKPRMDLLIDGCPNALEAVASVLTFGAQKYADNNWHKVANGKSRYKAALMRHLTAAARGEEFDSETGMSHLAHAACNALFILELEFRNNE